jgi:alkylhydroperoxidase family enzyme/SAM-dependent methyltransferase
MARGATCAGIDASPRLIAVAQDRVPQADIRVGDMHALPWDDASFDAVTSFRGIWGTTPDALDEVLRVLAPGGRLGLTVWGHIKRSPGSWALVPFLLASEPKVANQAAMVALGRPGAGEELLARYGFVDIERFEVPFAWEFADPQSYARSLASTGPAYEAIQAVGEEAFFEQAVALAAERVRDGLPLRDEIAVVGYAARKPAVADAGGAGFLTPPVTTPEVQALYDGDLDGMGYVMNTSKVWAQDPAAYALLSDMMGQATRTAGLSLRQRAVLVTATASTMGDSYCSLAWGRKLAAEAGADVAASSLRGDDELLDPAERALARWARRVTADPNGIDTAAVEELRAAGFGEQQIFAVTLYVAMRQAFSTVNDALGARPDRELAAGVPPEVRHAVTFGRPPALDP